MMRYCSRRILVHPEFSLHFSTPQAKPQLSPVVASLTTLINYGSSNETLITDLLTRSFALVCPKLYSQHRSLLTSAAKHKQALAQLNVVFKQKIEQSQMDGGQFSLGHVNVDVLSELISKRSEVKQFYFGKRIAEYYGVYMFRVILYILLQLGQRLKDIGSRLVYLSSCRDELVLIARRGTMLFSLLRSLSLIQKEYHFTLPMFLNLFDQAIGGEFPEEFIGSMFTETV